MKLTFQPRPECETPMPDELGLTDDEARDLIRQRDESDPTRPPELVLKDRPWASRQEDVDRIVYACVKVGYWIEKPTAYELWRQHSASCGADWLDTDGLDVTQVVAIALHYCRVAF
jgi:hypothetical protein